jgi:DNA-directed RNA polymerase specialized sigma24 family protein
MNRAQFPFATPPAAAADAELGLALRACARHSLPALRRIHELTAPRLLAQLLQVLGDRKAADAALVDCFVHIWHEAADFNPQRSQPRTWLQSIARHHAVDLLRASPEEATDDVDSALSFMHVGLHYEGGPPEQRLLELAWRSGRSAQEIARALNLPVRGVRQEIRSALQAMQPEPPALQRRALEHVAGAYALGTLNPRARRRFRSLMLQDIEIRRSWQQWEQRLSALTPDLPPVRPPDKAWTAIEHRLAHRPPRAAPRRWLLGCVLVVGIALALVWLKVRS